jgi:hypothetical protein
MQYQELYQEILGLKSPWTASMVSLDVFRQPVDLYVEYPTVTEFRCPHRDKADILLICEK